MNHTACCNDSSILLRFSRVLKASRLVALLMFRPTGCFGVPSSLHFLESMYHEAKAVITQTPSVKCCSNKPSA